MISHGRLSVTGVVVPILVSVFVAGVLTPRVIEWLVKRDNFDIPSARSSHATPVPRGGGIAVIAGTLLGVFGVPPALRAMFVILLAGAALGGIGLAEDLRGLSAKQRLCLQFGITIVAGAILAHGVYSTLWYGAIVALIAFFVTMMCNVVNFMDGINGISCAQAVCAGAAYALYGGLERVVALELGGLALVGAAIGFAPFNFPRARIFLGDSGSYFLGGWLGLLASIGFVRGLNPAILVTPFLVYLTDTSFTLLKRFLRRAPLMEPHREHVYQRLVLAGWSHEQTTFSIFALMSIQTLCALLLQHTTRASQVTGGATILLSAVGYLGVPWLIALNSKSAIE